MSLSTSSEAEFAADPALEAPVQRTTLGRGVFLGGVVLAAALMLWGAWERRWIADDGLIVLRTVRNLLAGNGPVFNAGERVEANTSTAWTYVVYAFGWLTQIRLEYVVLTIALVLSTAAIVLAMLGTARLYRGVRPLAGGTVLLAPAGVLVYIAVPPARDFATSGLETCLVIFWLALLWLLLIRWTQASVPSTASVLTLSFVAGLAPLIRPEMAIPGAVALLMIILSAGLGWKVRVLIVLVAGLVPVGYQIWRMGYYALPYPNTAVSKDAGGAKWAQGFAYLWNLVGPYLLWLPLLFLLVGAILLGWRRRGETPAPTTQESSSRVVRLQAFLRTPRAAVAFVLGSGLILGVYSLRVGGDFMHGRVLLPVLFLLLIPVAVIPLRLPARTALGANRDTAVFGVSVVLWIGTIVWAFFAANTTGMPQGAIVGRSGIVDERAFYNPQHRARSPDPGRGLPRLPADAGHDGGHRQHPRGWSAAAVRKLRPLVRRAAAGPVGPTGRAHRLLPQPGDDVHERRSRRPCSRPDGAGVSVGGAYRAPRGRPDRARQIPVPGLGRRRYRDDGRASVVAVLPRRGLGSRREVGADVSADARPPHLVPVGADVGSVQAELP
ncbi:hypothetical protein ABH922_004883 [Rhodococcus sp. 27YEA15]